MVTFTRGALLLSAAAMLAGCATVKPRLLCSEVPANGAVMVGLEIVKGDGHDWHVQPRPDACVVKGDTDVAFQPSSAFKVAASITFVDEYDDAICKNPVQGASPLKGTNKHPVGKFENGFAQVIETRIDSAAPAQKYYYCVGGGVGPMPYPAIIIKPD
jgi:hypothetical protein